MVEEVVGINALLNFKIISPASWEKNEVFIKYFYEPRNCLNPFQVEIHRYYVN